MVNFAGRLSLQRTLRDLRESGTKSSGLNIVLSLNREKIIYI